MGKARPSALTFAVAYLALIVGLFLALGGAAYAQSPAIDQYGPVRRPGCGRSGLGDGRWRHRLGRRRVPGASEHRSFASRRRRPWRRAGCRRARPPAPRAAQELAGARNVTRPVEPSSTGVQLAHPVVRGASLCAACDLGQLKPCDPAAWIRSDGVARRRPALLRDRRRPAAALPRASSGSCDHGSSAWARRACVRASLHSSRASASRAAKSA